MNLSVEYSPVQKTLVNVKGTTPIQAVIDECVAKFGLSASLKYALLLGRKPVDPQLDVRFAGLQNGAKLTLVATSNAAVEVSVKIAIQLDSDRFLYEFNPKTTLLQILVHLEESQKLNILQRTASPPAAANKNFLAKMIPQKNVYLMPVIIYLNKEFSALECQCVSLKDLGMTSSGGLLRLLFKPMESIDPYMKAIAEFKQILLSSTPSSSQQPEPAPSKIIDLGSQVEKKPNQVESAVPPQEIRSQPNASNVSNLQKQEPASMIGVTTNQDDASIPQNVQDETQIIEPNVQFFLAPPEGYRQAPLPEPAPLTALELKMYHNALKETVDQLQNQPLMTQKMRDLESSKRLNKYPKTTIRVKFPDSSTMVAVFSSFVNLSKLYDVVGDWLSSSAMENEWTLYTCPPRKDISVDMNKTFAQAGLAPASLVYFSSQSKKPWIKSDAKFLPFPVESLVKNDNGNQKDNDADSNVVRNDAGLVHKQNQRQNSRESIGDGTAGSSDEPNTKKGLPKWLKLGPGRK